MIRRRAARGFTLLETLVSLAIAALVLNGFYEGVATGTRLIARGDQQAERMLVAASVLDRVGADIPLRGGTTDRGTTDGHAWELVVTAAPPSDLRQVAPVDGRLLFVSVTVAAPDGGDDVIVLRAARYAPSPA